MANLLGYGYFDGLAGYLSGEEEKRGREQRILLPPELGKGSISRLKVRQGIEVVMSDMILHEDWDQYITEDHVFEIHYCFSGDTDCFVKGKHFSTQVQPCNVYSMEASEIHLRKKSNQLYRALEVRLFPVRLTSQTGDTHLTKTVVIAIGGGTLVPQKLELPSAKQYEGRHLHYSIDDIEQFRNKRVLISGGGDSAVDWAITLAPIAAFVGIVHRRSEFRAHEGNVTKMRNASVHVMTSSQIKEINGDEEHIERVMIEQTETGNSLSLEMDEVIVCHGARPDLGGIKNWGLEMENNHIIVDAWMQTSLPGVFSAGDVVGYPGKLPGLIAGGFMEGPAAINRAKAYVEPHKEIRPIWSTDHEVLLSIHNRAD